MSEHRRSQVISESHEVGPRLVGAAGHGLQLGLGCLWLGSSAEQTPAFGGPRPDRSNWRTSAPRLLMASVCYGPVVDKRSIRKT